MRAELKIYDHHQLVFATVLNGEMELGRQQPGEPSPFAFSKQLNLRRLIVASTDDNSVSRRQAQLTSTVDGKATVTNLSSGLPIELSDGRSIAPLSAITLDLPVVFRIGNKTLRLIASQPDESDGKLERLAVPTLMPGDLKLTPQLFSNLNLSPSMQPSQENILEWLQAMMSVFQSAANSERFLEDAAQAVCGLAKLDFASVLQLDNGQWKVSAFHSAASANSPADWQPSSTVLAEVVQSKSTVRQLPAVSNQPSHSLLSVQSLVVSPLLDANGNVIGALYGDRRSASGANPAAISEIEAQLVDLLACGVSTGLARLEQEKVAVAARVRFEQFFTSELSRQLELEPDLLRGRDAAVTLLFCDIRRFSSFSEILGPQGTFELINDVMEVISECVIDHGGVLVDYIGDELMAMWGAPAACDDQAVLACRAGIDAVRRLPELNQRWRSRLGGDIDFGVGINSGTARVGNAGSPRKFKYGPVGSTVNLASRVQGATKQLGVRFMVTGSTASKLNGEFHKRRLCCVRVVNMAEPTELYEIADSAHADWVAHQATYTAALEAFEKDDSSTAIHLAGGLVKHLPNDGPTLLLLSRAIERARFSDLPFDPVWTLDRK
jgi:adenylate cyclase